MRASVLALALLAPLGTASESNCGLADVEISPDGTTHYVPSRCTHLRVDGDTEGIDSIIAAVEMHSALTSLDLSRDPSRAHHEGGLEAEHIQLLVGVLPNSSVQHLSLAFNRVGDAGAEIIADALASLSLTSLDLDTTGINNKGGKFFAAALEKNDSDLETINFSHNNVGGAADELISAAKKNSKLKTVGDEGTTLGRRAPSGSEPALRSVLKGQCVTSEWSEWSECPDKCGPGGKKSRSRKVLHMPHSKHGLKTCPQTLEQAKVCPDPCDSTGKPKLGSTVHQKEERARLASEAAAKQAAEETAAAAEQARITAEVAAAEQAAEDEAAAVKQARVEADEAAAAAAAEEEEKAAAAEQAHIEDEDTAAAAAAAAAAAEEDAAAAAATAAEEDEAAAAAEKEAEAATASAAEEYDATAAAEQGHIAAEGAAPPEDFRSRLVRYYTEYNPDKLGSVDEMLARYKSREETLFSSLVAKYGPEPEAPARQEWGW